MEEKKQYTFEELCEGLEISMSKFSKRANVDEGTIARIRKGHLARRGTINSLLRAFSEIYGIKFTTENVTGLKKVEKPITPIAEKSEKPHVLPQTPEKPQKRTYNRRKDAGLPPGYMLATDFARAHNVDPRTFYDHMLIGLGPGLIHAPDVPEDGTVVIKDYARSEERIKRTWFDKEGKEVVEKERYLTSDQQTAALDFWKRHGIDFKATEE